MKRFVEGNQRHLRVTAFTFDAVSNANTVTGPDKKVVTMLSDVGTGSHTFTLAVPHAAADMSIIVTSITDKLICSVTQTSASTIAIKTWNDAGTATDGKYSVLVIGTDTAEYR
jgi:hypothetical protein